MSKIYIAAGQQVTTDLVVRIGATGTVVDIVPDWTATENSCGGSVGTFFSKKHPHAYDVYLEEHTGRLWYDDECGY